MNARFAHVLSRLSLVSVVAISGFGAAACNSRAPTTTPAPVAETTEAAPASASAQHGPGQRIFRQVEALDLRADQRAAVSEIEQNLRADLSPHRETLRQVVKVLAAGVESGQLDPAEAATQKQVLAAAAADARASFVTAVNGIHDVLDAGQRAELVARLQEQRLHGHVRGEAAEPPHGPVAKLAFELGLSEEQKQSIRDAIRSGVEEVFPDRKARREAEEAKLKALADAFVTDEFDAADHDLGGNVEAHLESFTNMAGRAIDISNSVLSVSQRHALAEMIRTRAEKL
jgi:Spy/CpxP family protein refolding chaperone